MKKLLSYLLLISLVILPPLNSVVSNMDKETYIITFTDKVNRDLITSVEGNIIKEYESIPTVVVSAPKYAKSLLEKSKSIESVILNQKIKFTSDEVTWGFNKVEAPLAWESHFSGKGVKIAIIDSGIDLEHEDLIVAGGKSFVDYTTSYDDDDGHGTHVAGIIGAKENNIGIKGVAPNASLYSLKVADLEGNASLTALISAFDWAITNDMDIINISMTSDDKTGFETSPLKSIVDKAYEQGILVVAAAGNTGTPAGTEDNVGYPAAYSSAIAVGALTQTDQRASFSSTGPALELAAPGYAIYSTYANNQYAIADGTSMAAPFVTGLFALAIEANPELSAQELRELFQKNALDLGVVGRDSLYGFGLATAKNMDVTKPSAPANVQVVFYGDSIQLSWDANDNVDLAGYKVYMNGRDISHLTVNTTSTFIEGLDLSKTYQFQITATDLSGNESDPSSIEVAADSSTTEQPQTNSVNEGGILAIPGITNISLSWDSYSAEHQGYNIYVNEEKVNDEMILNEFYTVTDLTAGQGYMIQIKAVGLSNEEIALSNPFELSTLITTKFIDVKNTNWAVNDIAWVAQKQWIIGNKKNEFMPIAPLTREQAAKIFVEALALKPLSAISPSFTDVKSDKWSYEYIEIAKQHGIFKGTSETTFSPEAPLTREQMAVVLYNILGHGGITTIEPNAFPDVDPNIKWSYDAIYIMKERKIFKGFEDGTFRPVDSLTREQMARIMKDIFPFISEISE